MHTAVLLGSAGAATAAAVVAVYDQHHATCIAPRLMWVVGSAVGLACVTAVGCVRRRAALADLRPAVGPRAAAAALAVFWGVMGAASYWPPRCMAALQVVTAVLVTGVVLFLLGAAVGLWVAAAAAWRTRDSGIALACVSSSAGIPTQDTPLLLCSASTGPVV
jgi:hypothetical protein